MPSKVYDQLDATAGVFTPSGTWSFSPAGSSLLSSFILSNGIGQFELQVNVNGDNSGPSTSATAQSVSNQIIQSFIINYLSQVIPDDARIQKIVYRRPASLNVNAVDGGADNQTAGSVVTDIFDADSEITVPPSAYIRVESLVGTAADIILLNLIGTREYITKDELIATYSLFTKTYAFGGSIIAIGNPPPNVITASMIFTLSIGQNWTVTVTYDEFFLWLLIQPDPPQIGINEGDTITMKSPDPATLESYETSIDFEDLTQIDILIPDYTVPGTFITINVPIGNWTLITSRRLQFTMPSWGGRLPTVVRVRIQGTQFSGTVERQLYTIYFVTASGIYQLVPGKTSDTLYIEAEPGETIDVKIPNPSIRTGYF